MKKSTFLLVVFLFTLLNACSKTEDVFIPQSEVFLLKASSDAKISGKITFTEKQDGSTIVLLEMDGSNDDIHPAFIYAGNFQTGGQIAISLEAIQCNCQASTTYVATLDDGSPISFDQLKKFNGHVRVHQSKSKMSIILANGNIGSNRNLK
tara:strand:- start:88929 stop:89381 length:453 start_codon:yes stop_codon:yes gene_type:complete